MRWNRGSGGRYAAHIGDLRRGCPARSFLSDEGERILPLRSAPGEAAEGEHRGVATTRQRGPAAFEPRLLDAGHGHRSPSKRQRLIARPRRVPPARTDLPLATDRYLGEEACCTITSRWGTSRSTLGEIHRSRAAACLDNPAESAGNRLELDKYGRHSPTPSIRNTRSRGSSFSAGRLAGDGALNTRVLISSSARVTAAVVAAGRKRCVSSPRTSPGRRPLRSGRPARARTGSRRQ